MGRLRVACCLVAAVLMAMGVPAAAAGNTKADAVAAQDHEVVATGLANPRGLYVDGDVVYVAESGAAGDNLTEFTFEGGTGYICVGDTGGVTRIDASGQSRIVVLPSAADAFFTEAGPTCDGPLGLAGVGTLGPSDVTGIGATLAVSIGHGGDEPIRDQVHPLLGTIIRLLPNGKYVHMADIVAHEQEHNPDGTIIDSNPNGITAVGGRLFVADAAANAVFEVQGQHVTTVAVLHPFDPVPFTLPSCLPDPVPGLPPPGMLFAPESVPTQVVMGADGYLYVTTLPGFPFTPGSAKILRVHPDTGETSVYAEGFSLLVGLDIGPDGALYVAEMVDGHLWETTLCNSGIPGRVLKVTDAGTEVLGYAPDAGDVAVAADGSVYVSVNSTSPTGGEVWRLGGN